MKNQISADLSLIKLFSVDWQNGKLTKKPITLILLDQLVQAIHLSR
jgi:hypothetical protein